MSWLRWAPMALLALGCAGELVSDPRCPSGNCPADAGEVAPQVDMCVVNTTALKTCRVAGCHMPPVSAGLDLSEASVTTNAKNFLDKANAGSEMACLPGMGKLIDPVNATNSLLYAKVQASGETIAPPCGAKMPVIGNFTMADKACILSWIKSVIALK
jgi:hypothetical protein